MKRGKLVNKQGISLIVLVITIIVIIVISVAVILNIATNNPIDNAKKAVTAWNKREELEQLNLCLAQYLAKKDNVSLSSYIKDNFELQEGVEEFGNFVTVLTEKGGYVLNKTNNQILVQSEKNIVEDISKVKKEYEACKETVMAEEKTTLENPYSNEEKYPENDSALVAILPSYNKDKYRLSLQNGNLVCLYDLSVMTEEKIKVCEAFNIYLLGDANGDHKLYYDDYQMIQSYVGILKKENNRDFIVRDVAANDVIDGSDVFAMNKKLSNIYMLTLNEIKSEVTKTRKEKIAQGISKDAMNATTIEEMKEYTTTYNENLGYKLKIRNGTLFFVNSKGLNSLFISHSGIRLIGDATGDGEINEEDIEEFKYYVIDEPTEAELISSDLKPIFDLNEDGAIDNQDLEILKSLINS